MLNDLPASRTEDAPPWRAHCLPDSPLGSFPRCYRGPSADAKWEETQAGASVNRSSKLRATLVPTGPAGTGQEAATMGQEVEKLPRPLAPNGKCGLTPRRPGPVPRSFP